MEDRLKLEKESIIILSIASNTTLVLLKLVIGFSTGLVSIVAEALHSANDLVASVVAYFGVKKSLQPADEKHQYGHGKWEVITGLIENILILFIAVYIVWEGINKIRNGHTAEMVELGIGVMAVSGLVNFFISRFLIKKGRELRSIGIEVDGEHLRADVITSLGVGAALLVMKFTGASWIDPAAAIFVGIWVFFIFVDLLRKLIDQITDTGLPHHEKKRIEEYLKGLKEIKDFHKIRTRQSGSTIFVDMHIKVDPKMTVERSHEITRQIEYEMKKMFNDTNALVHVEPFRGKKGGK